MKIKDVMAFSTRSLSSVRARTFFMLLAMSIGVASVVMLTALGEGARLFVVSKFSALGTNLLIVFPGRSETTGGHPPLLGETPRDLTLEDAFALLRHHAVRDIAPLVVGAAPVSLDRRERTVSILGTTSVFLSIRRLQMGRGQFLPSTGQGRVEQVCVLGSKLASEIFDTSSPVGASLRIGDRRYRVSGVLAPTGMSLGVDMDDVAIVPVVAAQSLFNTNGLFRIMVEARSREQIPAVKQAILGIIRERHEGEDDITVVTQDAVLATFDRIFKALTVAVAGIAAISLLVAGVLTMNVMLVAVSQRRAEIGLLKALGAPSRQVLLLFLAEAFLLSLFGAILGTFLGYAGMAILRWRFPDFPVEAPFWAFAAAFGTAMGTGLLFSLLPARRAARLDPVVALAGRR